MFTKFPSIESFAHVWKSHTIRFIPETARYGAKVKIHGTNAAVRIHSDGTVVAQKRSSDISPLNDNAGFAKWVEPRKEAFAAKARGQTLVIFGEWAGPGIQKGDAVARLRQPYFFVFAAQLGDYMVTSPNVLEDFIPDLDDILVLPWEEVGEGGFYDMNINFANAEDAKAKTQYINDLAESIGHEDPFIRDTFGVLGSGEGLVFMPLDSLHRDDFARLTFKVKAERHRVKQTKQAASVEHEIPAQASDFVKMFVTPQRVAQGVAETNGGVFDKSKMGDFMKWMGNDVRKESAAELEALGLEWKQVAKSINAMAARMFLLEAEKID